MCLFLECILHLFQYSFTNFILLIDIDYNQINKYVSDFTHVYNFTWKDFRRDFEPVQEAYILKFMKDAKIIIEEKFISFEQHFQLISEIQIIR